MNFERLTKIIWILAACLMLFILFDHKGKQILGSENILVVLTTVGAAFGGAWAAYKLQWRRLESERREAEIRSLNAVQIGLLRQLRLLEMVRKDHIDPVRKNSRYALLMKSSIEYDIDRLDIDIGSLSFLLDRQEGQIILQIGLVEDNFRTAIATFNERSRLMREDVLPLLEKNEDFNFLTYSNSELIAAIGMRLTGALKSTADHVINFVDSGIDDVENASIALREASTSNYPGAQFIKIFDARK